MIYIIYHLLYFKCYLFATFTFNSWQTVWSVCICFWCVNMCLWSVFLVLQNAEACCHWREIVHMCSCCSKIIIIIFGGGYDWSCSSYEPPQTETKALIVENPLKRTMPFNNLCAAWRHEPRVTVGYQDMIQLRLISLTHTYTHSGVEPHQLVYLTFDFKIQLFVLYYLGAVSYLSR